MHIHTRQAVKANPAAATIALTVLDSSEVIESVVDAKQRLMLPELQPPALRLLRVACEKAIEPALLKAMPQRVHPSAALSA